MNPVERIEYMLKMEATRPEKDGAGIFIPQGMDAAIRRKTLEEVLKVMRGKEK